MEPGAGARARVAVLASGGGSNLQALFDHADALGEERPYDVALVASDRAACGAQDRAQERGVPVAHLRVPADGEAMLAILRAHDIAWIVLAGYLKLVPAAVTRAFAGRILNVHPSLLPAFGGPGMYGARVHQAVLNAGARVSGATVHFVDEAYDRGAVVAQWPVPVFADDTPALLAARVLRVEHALLPRAVAAVVAGRVALGEDGRARGAYAVGPRTESVAFARGAAFLIVDDPLLVRAQLDDALGRGV